MGFLFKYEPNEFARIIPAVLIDARADIPAIANQIGTVIKAYCDVEIDKVQDKPTVLFFRVETIKNKGQDADGVLAGYFSLFIFHQGTVANLFQFQLRPAFKQNSAQIQAEISNFIGNFEWRQYDL